MRTAAIKNILLCVLCALDAAGADPRAVIVFDVGAARPSWVVAGARAAPNLHRFCREGVSALAVDFDATKAAADIVKTLLAPREGYLLARMGKGSWLIAPTAVPFGDLAGGANFFAADLGAPAWRDLRARFGLRPPLAPAEVRAAEMLRRRFGPPLERSETEAAAALSTGGVEAGGARTLFDCLERVAVARPPLAAVIAWDVPGVEQEAAAARDASLGKVYESLCAPESAGNSWFFYLSIPPAATARGAAAGVDAGGPANGGGAAVLWGPNFRRGVVSIEPVAWDRLAATILMALGVRKDASPEAILPQFLEP